MQTPVEPPEEPAQLSLSQPNSVNPSPLWWNCAVWRAVRLLLLALTVTALWLTIENRWGSNFQLPTRYEHDVHYILGMMKLAQEGDLGLFTHIYTDSLGAPFKGQLNDFPQTERALIWVGGQIARVVGLIPAANVMLILSSLVAAFSFYLAVRLWKIPQFSSFIFAVVYSFLPQNLISLAHLGVIFSGLLPLQLYSLWYISTSQRLSWRSNRFRLTVVVSLLSGLLNIYWIFLFIQLYFIALLCRLIKRRLDLFKGLIPLIATCLAAGLVLGSFILHKINYGGNSAALVRSYGDVEALSLKPIELFLPGSGSSIPIAFLSKLFSRYYDGGRINVGEVPYSYIGFCAILGLLVLFFNGVFRQLNKRAPSLPYLASMWIIAYISFGGIHSIFSLVFDFYNIRGTSRYTAALATIGLLYLAFVSYRLTRRFSPIARGALWGFIALFGLLEQSWRTYNRSHSLIPSFQMSSAITQDQVLAVRLERSLTPSSMVFILPATVFPEPFWGRGAGKGEFGHYQAMRPFLFSTKLRYSYGSHKGRQGADWQLDVQELPAREMVAALESYGFAGILLNRKGYEDRGELLLSELAEAGWPMEFEQGIENEWVFIRLTPAEEPVLPTLAPYALTARKES